MSGSELKAPIWITKIFLLRPRAAVANSFLPTSSTCLIVSRASTVINDLQLSSQSEKLISVLLKEWNGIPKAMLILMLANKKVSLKYQDLLYISSIWKVAIIIPNVYKWTLSIFWAMTSVFPIQKSSYLANFGCTVFISLPESIKIYNNVWPNWIKYWMQRICCSSNFDSIWVSRFAGASISKAVIDKRIARIDTGFLAWDKCWHNGLPYHRSNSSSYRDFTSCFSSWLRWRRF